MRPMRFDDSDHDVDEIKALMKEVLEGLTLEKIMPDKGIPDYRRKARKLIHETYIEVVQQLVGSGINQEEWGHELLIEALVCLAADLYKRRVKSQ